MKSRLLLTFLAVLFFTVSNAQVAPSFNGGSSQTLAVCQNSGTNSIDSKLITTDPDANETLTYTVSSAPLHGTVHGFPGVQSTGNGGIVSPSGFDYTPNNGYNGLDSFIVTVNDGTFSSQTKIIVTINSLPTVAAITGTTSLCLSSNNTSQLANATSGGVWSSSNVFVADINGTGLVTAQAAGTATISYTVTNGTTNCSNTSTTTLIVGGEPVVNTITGTTTVCVGNTTQLNNSTTGGVWTSSNTTRATVNSSTGLVTGIAASNNVIITYTLTNAAGCTKSVNTQVTVNAKPNIGTISANTTTICAGNTTQLTITGTGGTWVSSNTSIATVSNGGANAGTVTGVANGTVYISYSQTNAAGCTAKDSVQITVTNGTAVSPITGSNTICVGKSLILSDATGGGTWSATPAFRGTITQAGVLTANAAGNITVTYSVTGGGGCTTSVTYTVTASTAPNLSAISGSNQVCVGSTTTLTNSTGGGTWSTRHSNISTINNSGVVTGVSAGNDTVSYVVSTNNCSDTVTYAITVTSSISVNPIQGANSVCMGTTLTLSNSTTGGSWSSSDNSIAIVISGTVTPIKTGVVAINYTVGSGACQGIASKNVIINPSPTVGAINGTSAICVGSISQLTDTTSDGVWSITSGGPGGAAATISSTGLVTPNNVFNATNATVSYTVTNSYGCTQAATLVVTINPKPNVQPITGTQSTCVGSLTTFTVSNPTGGVWTSFSNNVIAQPVPSTPNNTASIIGNSPGTDTIYYTVTNGNGCATVVSRTVTIDNTLIVADIVGPSVLCLGSTNIVTYTNATTGGTWQSSNTAAATIGQTNGTANPASVGTTTFTYTVDKGGTCVGSKSITVNVANRPGVPTVSGPNSVCVGDSITLTGNPGSGRWISSQTNFLTIDSLTGEAKGIGVIPGPGGTNVNVTYTITNAAGCSRTTTNTVTVNAGANIGQITPVAGGVCVGQTLTLSNTATGGKWTSSNPAFATIDSITGVATGIAAGNVIIRYTVSNTSGCASVAQRFLNITATPNAGTLSGQSAVCVGASTTLISSANAQNPVWSSSNASLATVSNTGVVTGVAVGIDTIRYTVSNNGCSATATKVMTVEAVPTVSNITSNPVNQTGICVNSTLQLNNSSFGGTWGVSNTNRATISNTGLLTGVGAGAVIVTYTVTNGTCSATAFYNVTIYSLPNVAAITGVSNVCVGANLALSNDSTGGVWSSDNTSVATITNTGIVTGVNNGTAIISYTKTNSFNCSKTVTKTITVNSLPTITQITGTTSLCAVATTQLSNATPNGMWKSVSTSVATISNTGLVTGVSAGTSVIRYTVTNGSGCSDSVSATVTVNALPSIASIAGNTSVCMGSTTTLTNATSGGSWSSTNISVATISNNGLVTPVAVGTTIIKYTVTNGNGCTDSVSATVIVSALPVITSITGTTTVCAASTTTLSNATNGGVWSSSATGVATVNASGVVLGVNAGTATIKYQVTNASGCVDSATTSVTVNALPVVASLTGVQSVCVGLTTTFTSDSLGGTWSSSNTNVATVSGGVVTGVHAGNATISYTVTNSNNCSRILTRTVTVNALPGAGTISGSSAVCVGSASALTNNVTGGVWTSSNTNAATVNSSTGMVTGLNAGITTITYTVSNANGCIDTTTKLVTVNDKPVADFTINNTTQCININSFIFTNTSTTPSGIIGTSSWNFGDNSSQGVIIPVTHVYATAGNYNVKLIVFNSFGCKDSITKSVAVKATSISSATQSACDSLVWNGTTYKTSGTYTFTTTNSVGCDSVATLILTIKLSTTSSTTHTACNSYTWNGVTYNTSGVYVKHFTNATGCDSTATLNLTVNYSSTSSATQAVCDSLVWNGVTYKTSGIYNKHFINSTGCDSTATLNLTVNYSTNSNINITKCNNQLPYTWNGTNYSVSGTYTWQGTNATGCDSMAYLHLTINDTTTSVTSVAKCSNQIPYLWNGVSYSISGTYTWQGTNAAGCDSVAYLMLTVSDTTTSAATVTNCDSYTWNGISYTTSGTYNKHFTNAAGCDSVAYLMLTITKSNSSNNNKTICESELPYSWNGLTFNAAGSQTAHLTNAAGCDSAATLVLIVNANPVVPAINGTPKVCIGKTTPLSNTAPNGVWTSSDMNTATVVNGTVTGVAAGNATISYTVTNLNGCSTTATINVTVYANPVVAAITGSNQVCLNATTTLSNDSAGGMWSSVTPATASVTSGGVVTGVSVGGTTIKYTVGDNNGCSASANFVITVNGLPTVDPITGTKAVCNGQSSQLVSLPAGGIWSTNNGNTTTDNTGNVMGIATGTSIITYTVTNAVTNCQNSASAIFTVNPLPVLSAINGANEICLGSNATYSNTASGGVWSSSDISVATIDAGIGALITVGAGTTTIKYIDINGFGCSDSVTKTITVNAKPAVAAITGMDSVCAGSFTIMSDATPNGIWGNKNNVVTINSIGLTTGINAGTDTVTYTVTDIPTGCSATVSKQIIVTTPAVAPITGINSLCIGSNSILATTTIGGVWSSSDTSIVEVDSVTGMITGKAQGSASVTYTIPVGNSCGNTASVIVNVNTSLIVLPITGDSTVCSGKNSKLDNATTGGTWSSSNTSVATIDALGNVTSVGAGISTIKYVVIAGSGCADSVMTTYTVNATPTTPIISVPSTICINTNQQATASSSGGVWSSSDANVISVDNAGNLSPVGSGSANITYTLTNAGNCTASAASSITVNALPVVNAIAGNATACLGSSLQLSNATVNGVWSSSNTSVATIDNLGEITTVGSGTTTITYNVTDANNCSKAVTHNVTVFALPAVAAITGTNQVCVGGTIILADATPNGVWSSVTPFVASVNNAGSVTGNFSGGTTIKYTVTDVTTTCSNTANHIISVNATPLLASIVGLDSICLNSSTIFTNTVPGGLWTSDNTSVITVNSGTGNITAVGGGMANITYTVTNLNGCSASQIKSVEVNVPTSSSTPVIVCNNMLPYSWNGNSYNAAGSYNVTLVNVLGCDSIATLILTVTDTTKSVTNQTVCGNMLPYSWNGNSYNTAGTYTWHGKNAANCDSVATLILTVKDTTISVTNQSVCDNMLPYVWNGNTYTTSGTYTYNTTNSAGCDSMATLNLTINTSPASPVITTATNNVTIPATGVTYGCTTVAGAASYTWSYTGTGATIATGQGTENITVDFAGNATNGDIQVIAVSVNGCNSAAATTSIVLPISITKFTATKKDNNALLNWNSSLEVNAKEYQVQRSTDGRNFEQIGVITAKGIASDYVFIDNNLPATVTIVYYRLKLIDRDGTFSYSTVRQLEIRNNKLEISLYPNPAREILFVKATNAKQIRIIDGLGKTVLVISNVIENGATQISVSSFAKGTYYVEVISKDGQRQIEKFVKE